MDYKQFIVEAKKATSPAKLKEFAATIGPELTDEQAAELFEKLQSLDASDSKEFLEAELASIAGGMGDPYWNYPFPRPKSDIMSPMSA